ncbi:hypothetical protein [Candidatus Igneacidithiobacillus taiwanensis]|uniref:hypothetical protein n=1 Tax=Candidatus Igneacidithiobacillus taiwanensis TaxID=1945924 RepID=UPI00289D9ADF|nr:hypothetical protein [Candidatus Igneacidithiobacillus taiwanensis]
MSEDRVPYFASVIEDILRDWREPKDAQMAEIVKQLIQEEERTMDTMGTVDAPMTKSCDQEIAPLLDPELEVMDQPKKPMTWHDATMIMIDMVAESMGLPRPYRRDFAKEALERGTRLTVDRWRVKCPICGQTQYIWRDFPEAPCPGCGYNEWSCENVEITYAPILLALDRLTGQPVVLGEVDPRTGRLKNDEGGVADV